MSTDQLSKRFGTTKASPRVALPAVTCAQGGNFHLNGDEIKIVDVRNAHTDGDSLVQWKKAKSSAPS